MTTTTEINWQELDWEVRSRLVDELNGLGFGGCAVDCEFVTEVTESTVWLSVYDLEVIVNRFASDGIVFGTEEDEGAFDAAMVALLAVKLKCEYAGMRQSVAREYGNGQ